MFYLRQATSATVMLGPFTGSNGAALTGLTITQSALMLSKNGAAFVAKNETTNASHRILGYYSAMFNATDTGSLGRMLVVSSAAAALPTWHEFTVLPTSVFDAVIQGTDLLQVDLSQIDGQATNGNNATLNLKQLSIINNNGTAVIARATNSGYGIDVSGGGTGHGVFATGGWSGGSGIYAITGSDGTGVGLFAGGQAGIYGAAVGSFAFAGIEGVAHSSKHSHGVYLEGGLRGSGLRAFSGVGSSADPYAGIEGIGINSGHGIYAFGGVDDGKGFFARGRGFGEGVHATANSAYAVSSSAANAIADALLRRDMAAVSDAAARSPINAMRAIRNRITTSGGVMAVYAEDDTTAVWTSTLTTNSSAEPIVESDPA